jgi:hypothetical protein
MRRLLGIALIGVAAFAFAVMVFAKTETVTGEVISLSCYFQNKANIGQAGMLCAIATVKWEGNPAGILTRDGKVYQITGELAAHNNARLVPLIGRLVTITGEVYEKRGSPMIAAADAQVVK